MFGFNGGGELIGFRAGGTAAAGITTLTFQNSSTSTAATITLPGSINAGDLIILFDRAQGTSAPAAVTPTGFTQIANFAASTIRNVISYKIAAGTESSSSITGMDGNISDAKIALVYRGDAAISTVIINDLATQATDADPTSQVVNASGSPAPLIVLGSYGTSAGGAAFTRTMSPAEDSEITASANVYYVKRKDYNSSPADVTVDMNDPGSNSNNVLASFYITVT